MLTECQRPVGLFRGSNIMTPEYIACYKVGDVYAELCGGRGMSGQKIYGVTVQPRPFKHSPRGDCFQSKAAALAYIEALAE